VLVGAELNAELEHQTAKDSTVGADHPMGRRDAQMADTLGRSVREARVPARRLASASPEWQAGFHEGARLARKRDKSSPVSLLLAVPAALTLMWLEGRRGDSRRRPRMISGT
jgi:membrane protein